MVKIPIQQSKVQPKSLNLKSLGDVQLGRWIINYNYILVLW